MNLFMKSLCVLSCFVGFSSHAIASDAEYSFTQEFLNVCNASQLSYNEGKKSFVSNDWSDAAKNMKEAMDPAFYLNHVKAFKAFQVETAGGGFWYGTMAKGKLQEYNVRMCNLWLVTDDISGIRQDFENVIGQTPSQKVVVEGEDRFIYLPEGATEFHFAQEADAGNDTFVIILSKVFAGK